MECKNITEKTAITWLDSSTATISTSKFCTGCGCNQTLGNPKTINFENTEERQELLKNNISEPFLSAVLAVWYKPLEVEKIEEDSEKTEI